MLLQLYNFDHWSKMDLNFFKYIFTKIINREQLSAILDILENREFQKLYLSLKVVKIKVLLLEKCVFEEENI